MLILFPFAAALLMLFSRGIAVRNALVRVAAFVTAAGSVFLAASGDLSRQIPSGSMPWLGSAVFAGELLICALLVFLSVRYKRPLALVLVLAQLGLGIYFETLYGHVEVASPFYVDKLSAVMACIIGVVGSLICVYAVGYMRDYHRHYTRLADRRSYFFFVLFVFLSGMFGIVFSNSLPLMLFFWEVTTVCSFLLIGYTRTKEAVNNSFRALVMNLSGGIAFALALIFICSRGGSPELAKLSMLGGAALLPAALLCYAGITKSAQMPFSSWLLGAMVAPTPTSALLHSSTMVKAGVFIIIKMSPLISGTPVGDAVAVIGGLTFLAASIINIAEPNMKKLLAYSTVANLGLIVACAGVGTPQAVWIAVVLTVFHAVSKSLLFLVVGTVENRMYTKEIESYDHLGVKMPVISALFMIGIAGMFIAPFGVVLSKWAAIEAFVKIPSILGPLLLIAIAFGSAATVFYWTKLAGKIVAVTDLPAEECRREEGVSGDEWTAEWAHAALSMAVCFLLPALSAWFAAPYVLSVYGIPAAGIGGLNYFSIILLMAMLVLLPLLLVWLRNAPKFNSRDTYMGGRTLNDKMMFNGAIGSVNAITLRNYYLETMFSESVIARSSNLICIGVLVLMILGGVLWNH
jgi:ech hydrogenase subunit A